MSDVTPDEIRSLLEKLAGQKAPLQTPIPKAAVSLLSGSTGSGLGYSQLNELLLLLGFDRVTHSFFQYLVDGNTDYEEGVGTAISSLQAFRVGIERFRKLALLLFGNVKYAFKTLSRDADFLARQVSKLEEISQSEFSVRHDPVRPAQRIEGKDTYYLGYIVQIELAEQLEKDAANPAVQQQEKRRKEIVEIGLSNHEAYLASDHLDVYVATSMRERHEFLAVSELVTQIFNQPSLEPLKLRWFDPTQAYCGERIDKGLSEALMLRRAKCTIYFAQESDTLGKDSELASTLAQGKAVIAFVPEVQNDYTEKLLGNLQSIYPSEDQPKLLLNQLRLFDPDAAWNNPDVRKWIESPDVMDLQKAKELLQEKITAHYDRRANTLKESHPLGIQVNLATGVANGVLVVRTVENCAELVRRIVTRTMEFELEERDGYTFLRESISGCVFRVTTADTMLTNAFWNFYLDPSE